MTLAPHDQVTLDRITGIMPARVRLWVRDIATGGGRYALAPEGPPTAVRSWFQRQPFASGPLASGEALEGTLVRSPMDNLVHLGKLNDPPSMSGCPLTTVLAGWKKRRNKPATRHRSNLLPNAGMA